MGKLLDVLAFVCAMITIPLWLPIVAIIENREKTGGYRND